MESLSRCRRYDELTASSVVVPHNSLISPSVSVLSSIDEFECVVASCRRGDRVYVPPVASEVNGPSVVVAPLGLVTTTVMFTAPSLSNNGTEARSQQSLVDRHRRVRGDVNDRRMLE